MSIRYEADKQRFTLETENTQYVFDIGLGKFLIHRHFGAKVAEGDFIPDLTYRNQSPHEAGSEPRFSMNDKFSEFAFFGNSNFGASALKLRAPAGDCCTRFEYRSHEIFSGRRQIEGIPCARAEEDTKTLAITLFDDVTQCELVLYYTVFPSLDIISRYFVLKNVGGEKVKLEKAMSLCLDLPGMDYDMISLYGAANFEDNVQRHRIFVGNQRVMSRRGATSHQHNPFVAVVSPDADEEQGDVYAMNLVYSGDFLSEVECSYAPKDAMKGYTRACIGIGEENFGYTLYGGESFESPEAILLYTSKGLGDMSRKMHRFVRRTIVPEEPFDVRPVVLNSWEATYFNIDADKLVAFAVEAIKYGMNMLVMDDGWFGKRNNDRAGLGDWFVNLEKFPEGLAPFIKRVKDTGMKFGIWIEPEMVNPDSDLYRAHPDWCISCRGREGSLYRNQLVLDLSNPTVVEYLKNTFADTFRDLPIDYIKWDFNRNLSETGSSYLPPERQDELPHRYMLGVYELYRWFTQTYPDMMIENCASGGGRYDLAMMSLSTQIWTSDNTTARQRVYIQHGATMGYPAYVMSCHVSDPTHNSEDYMRSLDYKFKVAVGGMLGYELDILKMSPEVKEEMARQIAFYRSVEEVIKHGDRCRLIDPTANKFGIAAYYYTPEAGNDRIFLSFLQNFGDEARNEYTLPVKVADKTASYQDTMSGEIYSGEQLLQGIRVQADACDEFGKLWLFEKM